MHLQITCGMWWPQVNTVPVRPLGIACTLCAQAAMPAAGFQQGCTCGQHGLAALTMQTCQPGAALRGMWSAGCVPGPHHPAWPCRWPSLQDNKASQCSLRARRECARGREAAHSAAAHSCTTRLSRQTTASGARRTQGHNLADGRILRSGQPVAALGRFPSAAAPRPHAARAAGNAPLLWAHNAARAAGGTPLVMSSRRMFDDLTSRWTMPRACRKLRALATSYAMRRPWFFLRAEGRRLKAQPASPHCLGVHAAMHAPAADMQARPPARPLPPPAPAALCAHQLNTRSLLPATLSSSACIRSRPPQYSCRAQAVRARPPQLAGGRGYKAGFASALGGEGP